MEPGHDLNVFSPNNKEPAGFLNPVSRTHTSCGHVHSQVFKQFLLHLEIHQEISAFNGNAFLHSDTRYQSQLDFSFCAMMFKQSSCESPSRSGPASWLGKLKVLVIECFGFKGENTTLLTVSFRTRFHVDSKQQLSSVQKKI